MRRFFLVLALVPLLRCGSSTPPTPVEAPVAPAPVAEKPAAEPAIGSVRVTASSANVRRDPTSDAPVLTQVKKGERLSLLASTESWMKIRLASGDPGWIASKLVTRDDGSKKAATRKGCAPDSEYRFVTSPTPSFSDGGKHGLVIVEASVDTRGVVIATRVVSNDTGDEALGFLTEREMKGARFAPPIRNCVPKAFIFTYKRSF